MCPLTSDVHFDPVIKVVSASVVHGGSTVFLFVINRDFVGTYFDTINISFLINLLIYSLVNLHSHRVTICLY